MHTLVRDAKEKMERTLDAFSLELSHIRTGRASVGLVDGIDVDAYGGKMKISQLGNIAVPEPRMILITPWDKSVLGAIERAILASNLDITPSNDGNVIRLPIPQLTEQRRKDLVKMVGKQAEEAKVAVRNVRRHDVESVKKAQKDGEIPEDDAHRLTEEIQKLTDSFCTKIDDAFAAKQKEIMEV